MIFTYGVGAENIHEPVVRASPKNYPSFHINGSFKKMLIPIKRFNGELKDV